MHQSAGILLLCRHWNQSTGPVLYYFVPGQVLAGMTEYDDEVHSILLYMCIAIAVIIATECIKNFKTLS